MTTCKPITLKDGTPCCTCTVEKFRILYGYYPTSLLEKTMTTENNIIYSNPRKQATIENWPYGKFRTTATFEIESNKRGERAVRVTVNPKTGMPNKPKACTYSPLVRIVDGSDDRTYIIALTEYGFIKVTQSDMVHTQEVSHPGDERFSELKALLS